MGCDPDLDCESGCECNDDTINGTGGISERRLAVGEAEFSSLATALPRRAGEPITGDPATEPPSSLTPAAGDKDAGLGPMSP